MIARATALLTIVLLSSCATAPAQRGQATDCADCRADGSKGPPDDPTYRVVERSQSPDAPPPDPGPPFEPHDPTIDDALLAEDDHSAAGDGPFLAVFRGQFARASGIELVSIGTNGSLTVRSSDGDIIAAAELGDVQSDPAPRAVRMVDQRLDVVVARRPSETDELVLSMHRVIGDAVAEVFRAPLEDAEVEFVRRGEERGIRVTTKDGAELYRWNKWEGMWRVPRPAPTQPR